MSSMHVQVYVVKELKVQVYSVQPNIDARQHIITNLEPTTQYMVSVKIANNVMHAILERHINTTMGKLLQHPELSIIHQLLNDC